MSTDADLIYNACLRAELRLEDSINNVDLKNDAQVEAARDLIPALAAIMALREEIGTGIARERP